MRCYRLHFRAPLHIDDRGTGYYEASDPFVRSDTVSAALLTTWGQLDPENATARAAKPPFRVSSAMPWLEGTPLLPRPVPHRAAPAPQGDPALAKVTKGVQWLSPRLWHRIWHEGWQQALHPDTVCTPQKEIALARDEASEPSPAWAQERRPRLNVDRITDGPVEGQLFEFGRIHFLPSAGLYLLAEHADETARQGFEAALSLLGDTGLGADRNAGNGQFTWEPAADFQERLGVRQTEPGESGVLVSLANPGLSERQWAGDERSAYDITTRGGWIANYGIRRARVRMLTEGSFLSVTIQGRVLDVTPRALASELPHPIYRDGRALMLRPEEG
ncbi:CRISPR-associated RAMP protein [Halorhodospira halochloris]|uniref:CRISPR system Cms protein Csm4 n=1 Tax=Halorhodospira halochloris TaxID=1052 RepID=A0A0X8XB35_HALHR|nr:type III-A CRISPR-associated RAMP protein Csm4 [Halorhodospira halochloris]MBK1651897.1 type III-A CRISPR-associated RAMP protein Csm4 [Halorhodospira halochloris]BAU58761.1 CRISPR-associated RAMP protein [Halorhodospira halochloris]